MPEVAIDGNANGTVIVTGDGNRISLSAQGELFYHPLDEAFREVQSRRAPADFYNGTRPNWANIAQKHDANRHMHDDLLEFVTNPDLPAQRMGIITGLSGEGKTTLLMRAAWRLAENGNIVIWRHSRNVLESYRLPLAEEAKLIICFDEITYVEKLPELISDLHESGLPFIVLGSARQYDWENSEFRSAFTRLVRLKEFRLGRLQKDEVQDLLERLDQAKALGSLEKLSPEQRVSRFLGRLEADGQLLPAMLTARKGQSFDQILESVFEGLLKRYGRETAEFLLRGYAGIALVHRFNFWMTRPLLAGFIGLSEDQIVHRLIHPLQGELLEISAGDEKHLSTRHPWIAEAALRMLCSKHLPEDNYLYQDLYRALGGLLQSNPLLPERKLLTMLPLAFKRLGEIKQACQIFKIAAEADPRNAPTLQAWALMEKENQNFKKARELFRQAEKADPRNAPTLQAWALMEKENRNLYGARKLFRRAIEADPRNAPTLQAWALMEKEEGDLKRARELFKQAEKADPKHAPVFQAWALMEKDDRNFNRARELFQKATGADPRDAPSWQAWALMESQNGDQKKAHAILEKGLQYVSTQPGKAIIFSTLGGLFARQLDFDQSRKYYIEALRLHEANALTHYHFAVDCLLPAGNRGEACQHLHRALQLRPRKNRDLERIQQALEKSCD